MENLRRKFDKSGKECYTPVRNPRCLSPQAAFEIDDLSSFSWLKDEGSYCIAVEVHIFVEQDLLITHFYHSGFSVASEHTLAVFDYWRGERGELTPDKQLTPEKLKKFDNVFVFISHEHIDHLDPVVFSWADAGNVSYIVSSDMATVY